MLKVTSNDKTAHLIGLVKEVNAVAGHAAECGVYQGGNLLYLARAMPGRYVYAFDTFCGLPAESFSSDIDVHRPGEFNDVEFGRLRFEFYGETNVVLKPGRFPESARGLENHKFAFVYCDFDFYRSTADVIAWFIPRMSAGGVIAFDDYDWPQCPGVKKAIDEAGLSVEVPMQYLAVARI